MFIGLYMSIAKKSNSWVIHIALAKALRMERLSDVKNILFIGFAISNNQRVVIQTIKAVIIHKLISSLILWFMILLCWYHGVSDKFGCLMIHTEYVTIRTNYSFWSLQIWHHRMVPSQTNIELISHSVLKLQNKTMAYHTIVYAFRYMDDTCPYFFERNARKIANDTQFRIKWSYDHILFSFFSSKLWTVQYTWHQHFEGIKQKTRWGLTGWHSFQKE